MNYGFIKVASAIPSVRVGDVKFNTLQIENLIAQAEGKGVEVLVFPELAITGYTCQDLFRQSLLLDEADTAMMVLLDFTRKLNIISIIGAPVVVGNLLLNCAVVIQQGEILGIGGLSECGMHEVGKAIFGASYDREGSVELADGTVVNDINTAINHSIAYASKDRDNESLIINDTIEDNITIPSMRDMGPILSDKRLRDFAKKYADIMSTKMVGVNQFVSALSGGNKQKVVLARWLAKQSDILILDSPTRGIDIKVKAAIYSLLEEMRNQDKAILIISEEIMELIGMCDRMYIMKDGKINGQLFRSPDLSEQDLISKMI